MNNTKQIGEIINPIKLLLNINNSIPDFIVVYNSDTKKLDLVSENVSWEKIRDISKEPNKHPILYSKEDLEITSFRTSIADRINEMIKNASNDFDSYSFESIIDTMSDYFPLTDNQIEATTNIIGNMVNAENQSEINFAKEQLCEYLMKIPAIIKNYTKELIIF